MSHIVPFSLMMEELTLTPVVPDKKERKAYRLPSRKPVTKKKKAGTEKRRATTGVRRGIGFTQNEIESLLELLQKHLRLGKEERDKVARLHELRYH